LVSAPLPREATGGAHYGAGPSSSAAASAEEEAAAAAAAAAAEEEAKAIAAAEAAMSEGGHNRPAKARQYNAVRAVLLRTPVSEALAGPALYARYLEMTKPEMRGPLPARPSRVSAASAAVGRPSPHSSAPPSGKVLTPLSTAPPFEQRPWPWEALLGTLPPSRSAELTEAAAAHVRASAAALGLGSTVDPAHVARAKELVAAHRSSTTRQG
jgi:hypothetical protein